MDHHGSDRSNLWTVHKETLPPLSHETLKFQSHNRRHALIYMVRRGWQAVIAQQTDKRTSETREPPCWMIAVARIIGSSTEKYLRGSSKMARLVPAPHFSGGYPLSWGVFQSVKMLWKGKGEMRGGKKRRERVFIFVSKGVRALEGPYRAKEVLGAAPPCSVNMFINWQRSSAKRYESQIWNLRQQTLKFQRSVKHRRFNNSMWNILVFPEVKNRKRKQPAANCPLPPPFRGYHNIKSV